MKEYLRPVIGKPERLPKPPPKTMASDLWEFGPTVYGNNERNEMKTTDEIVCELRDFAERHEDNEIVREAITELLSMRRQLRDIHFPNRIDTVVLLRQLPSAIVTFFSGKGVSKNKCYCPSEWEESLTSAANEIICLRQEVARLRQHIETTIEMKTRGE